jgi:uncharacterized membrane protein
MLGPAGKRVVYTVTAVAIVAGGFTAAGLVSRRLFEGAPGDRTSVAAVRSTSLSHEAETSRFRVAALQGSVECLQNGRAYVLQAGDLLSVDDVLRTPAGSRVILRRGKTEIEVREKLSIRLDELARETSRFGVLSGDGDIAAKVGNAGENVAISAEQTEAVNEGASRFVVSLTAKGTVGVAVAEGQVLFKGRDRQVRVPAGQESVAPRGQPPSAPSTIPQDLMLSVTWPEAAEPMRPARISGTARPLSRVKVNGREVEVQTGGSFTADVPVRGGETRVEVDAIDLWGRSKKVTGTIRPQAPPPTLQNTTEELWKK